jgi:quercetin dioxygenase-like cupin family protein
MSTANKSEILHMADLVAYNEGSVVSRQITKAEAGNVTLFAFDKDQELSEHTAPFDALVHVLEGEAEISISGSRSI